MMIAPQLHIAEVGRPARTVEVRGITTMGYASDSDIVLDEATVSLRHALLFARSEQVAPIWTAATAPL